MIISTYDQKPLVLHHTAAGSATAFSLAVSTPQPQSAKRPDVPLHRALIPVALLGASVYLFGDDSSSGPNQIALVLGTVVAAVVGLVGGQRWKELEQAISQGISTSMGAILISDGWSFSTPTGNSASVPAMPIGSTQVPGTSRYRVAPASILCRPRSRPARPFTKDQKRFTLAKPLLRDVDRQAGGAGHVTRRHYRVFRREPAALGGLDGSEAQAGETPLEHPLGEQLVDSTCQRVPRVVAPVGADAGESFVQRMEGVGSGPVYLAIQQSANVVESRSAGHG